MNFKQYLGKYVCGNISEMDYPELALVGILEGYGSKHLGYLAGMKRTDEISKLRKHLSLSLTELEGDIPSTREAGLLYSSGIVDEVLKGEKEIIKGVYEIKNYALFSNYDFFSESEKYCFDTIGFESIYSLFNVYYDLLATDNPKQEKLHEIEKNILAELKIWNDKLKTLYIN
jgi:hypothetical protein